MIDTLFSSGSVPHWIFALWVVTAALGAPLVIAAVLGPRWARAQRRVVRTALAGAPLLLVAGLLLPDPFGGRPLFEFGSATPAESGELAADVDSADGNRADVNRAGVNRAGVNRADGAPTADRALAAAEPDATPEAWPFAEPPRHLEDFVPPEPVASARTLGGPRPDACAPDGDAFDPSAAPFGPPSLPHASLFGEPAVPSGALPPRVESALEVAPALPASFTPEVESSTGARSLASRRARPPAALSLPGELDTIRHPTAVRAPAPEPTRTAGPVAGDVAGDVAGNIAGVGAAAPTPDRAPSPSAAAGETARDGWLAAVGRGLLAVWILGALLGLVRLLRSAVLLARTAETASAVGSTRGVPDLDADARALPVRLIPGLGSAAAVGVLRREIWIPTHWSAELDRPALHALLQHESAHHRGRDPLWRIIGAFVQAVLWPHPLVHALRRREETLGELVADRHVLAAGIGPRRYAGLLADLASIASGRTVALASGVLGTRSPLERRIRMILSTTPDRAASDGGWVAPALLGSILCTALGLSFCFPLVGEACDPEDECGDDAPVEVVLKKSDGTWRVLGRSGDAARWITVLGDDVSGDSGIVNSYDGGRAIVTIGDHRVLLDAKTGALLRTSAPTIQVEDAVDDRGIVDLLSDDHVRDDPPRAEGRDLLRRRLAELEAREVDLLNQEDELATLHRELERRLHEQESHRHEMEMRVDEELARAEEELARARAELERTERSLRRNPEDNDARREVERRAIELRKREAEVRAQHAARVAHMTTRLADDRLQLQDHAFQELREREQMIARLQAELAAQHSHLEHEAMTRAQEEFERAVRVRARGSDEHDDDHEHDSHDDHDRAAAHESADAHPELHGLHEEITRALHEAMRELHEEHEEVSEEMLEEIFEDAEESFEGVHDMFEDMHSRMEEMHEAFEALEQLPRMLERLRVLEELPALLEPLHQRNAPRAEGERAAQDQRMAELAEALATERARNDELRAANQALKKEIERLKKRGTGLR